MNQQLPSSLTSFEIFYMSLLLNWHSIQAVTLAEMGSWLTDVGFFFFNYEDWSDAWNNLSVSSVNVWCSVTFSGKYSRNIQLEDSLGRGVLFRTAFIDVVFRHRHEFVFHFCVIIVPKRPNFRDFQILWHFTLCGSSSKYIITYISHYCFQRLSATPEGTDANIRW